MRRQIRWLIPTVAAGLSLCLLRPQLVAQEPETSQSYQLSYVSKTGIDFGWCQVRINEHEGTVTHTLSGGPGQTTLLIDRLRQKYTGDGAVKYDTTIDRDKITRSADGKTTETLVRDLPEGAQARILQTFGVPLCTTDYDATGAETKRTVVADAAAKMDIVMSEMNNTMFFHPPFVADKDEWQYATEFDTIDPGIARGQMTYKKVEKFGHLVTVKSSGVFTSATCPLPGGINAKDLKYVVTGDHVYDRTRHAWVSATATVEVSYRLEKNGIVGARASGTMNWKLETLPAK
jgi:hypothetical protein